MPVNRPKTSTDGEDSSTNDNTGPQKSLFDTLSSFRPSISTVTVCIFVAAIIVVCSGALAISISLSLRGAKTIAENLVLGVAEQNIAQVQTILSYPVQASNMLQFKTLSKSSSYLPTDEAALIEGYSLPPFLNKTNALGQDGWAEEWTSSALSYSKGSEYLIRGTSISFADGSSATCLNVPEVENEVVVTATSPYGFTLPGGVVEWNRVPTSKVYYSTTDGAVTHTEVTYNYSDDLRDEEWYTETPRYPLVRRWSSVSMSYRTATAAPTPIISLSSPLFNRSGTFLGVAWFTLALDVIDTKMKLAEQATVVDRSYSILLDTNLRVVASSLPEHSYTITVVPDGYELTPKEVADGCVLSDDLGTFCQHTISSFGFQPLIDLAARQPDIFILENKKTFRLELDGEIYYARVATLGVDTNLTWQMASLIPESDITGSINKGRDIAIGVSIALIVVVGTLVGAFIRILFHPLADIAQWLETGAYLRREEDQTDADAQKAKRKTNGWWKAMFVNSSTRKSPPPRAPQTLSRLSDVAAIQKAYWEMAGELKALRGYIPEHITRELLSPPPPRSKANNSISLPAHTILVPDNRYDSSGYANGPDGRNGGKAGGGSANSKRDTVEMIPMGSTNGSSSAYGGGGASLKPILKKNRSVKYEHTIDLSDVYSSLKGGGGPRGDTQSNFSHRSAKQVVVQVTREHLERHEAMVGGGGGGNTAVEAQGAGRAVVPSVYLLRDSNGNSIGTSFTNATLGAVTVEGGTTDTNTGEHGGGLTPKGKTASRDTTGSAVHGNGSTTIVVVTDEVAPGDKLPPANEAQANPSLLMPNGAYMEPLPSPSSPTKYPPASQMALTFTGPMPGIVDEGDLLHEGAGGLSTSGYSMPQASIEDPSEVAVRQGFVSSPNGQLANDANTPIYFRDNLLVDRDVAIAVINVVGFHQYAQVTHGTDVTKDHQVLVSYVHEAARRCGGVLDTFSGDKFWVSFNATTKCVNGLIAATAFALEVVTTINREAAIAQRARRSDYERRYKNLPPLPSAPIRFRAALRGVTAGVAAGRAFVGPLGTDSVRRHTIISGAMSEAAALERMALRYPGSGLIVGGDTIPSIEGYFQYLLLDASLLPGSGGLRRRIATVKAPMCAPGCDPSVLRGLADGPLSTNNPFAPMNGCFNAFLEGRMRECAQLLDSIDRVVAHDLLVAANIDPAATKTASQQASTASPDTQSAAIATDRKTLSLDRPLLKEEAIDTSIMLQFVWGLANGSEPAIDGRLYRCKLGDVHLPADNVPKGVHDLW